MDPTTRRGLLASAGAGVAVLAGCAGGRNDPSGYPVRRLSVGETATTDDGAAVTVGTPRLRTSVVVDQHTSPVGAAAERQWIVVDVTVDGAGDGPGPRFRALTDGRPVEGRSAPLRPDFHPAASGRPVGVPVPVAPADSAAVAWVRGLPESVLWTLPKAVVSGLDAAAAFRVERVAVSDGTDPRLTLTVRNEGDRDGTFHANVAGSQVQDGNAIVGFDVPAGRTVTRRKRPGIVAPRGEATRVTVDWGTGERALVVRPS
ncbi:MAG: hypothetical protein ABEJ34_01985 [Haloferacaceae archaeon]